MGARHSEVDTLAKRCADAGWIVDRYSKGWKVYTPDGPITLHTTLSDHRAIRNATADLERRGLTEAENRMALLKNNVRIASLDKDRAKNDAALAAAKAKADAFAEQQEAARQVIFSNIETNQALLGRAQTGLHTSSGPLGGAEDLGIHWYVDKHPQPWMRWVNMTPEIASYIMAHHNDENRPIRPSRVRHYKNIILAGRWHMTHQGMAMDNRGVLQDGQHRLQAMIDAGAELDTAPSELKFPTAFFVGMPPENFAAIDEGALRTAADLFARNDEKNVVPLQACVRLVRGYQDPNPRGSARNRITNEEVMSIFDTDAAAYREAVAFGVRHHKKIDVPGSPLSAAYYLIAKANGEENPYVAAYFDGLVTGTKGTSRVMLDDNDPRANIRVWTNRAAKDHKRVAPMDMLAVFIIGWNYCITGERKNNVRIAKDMAIPRILISKPGEGATPAAFADEIEF